MNALTDIELEQQAADGERDAFGVLYERYSNRVYDFLLRMVREPAEAADLMQETFVRALRSLSAERAGTAEFATWLFTIARNLALTRMERARRTEPLADDEEDASVYYRFDPDRLENPETAAQAFEMASLVWAASEALEPKQRTLLDLHVRQGLESAEIAEVLGVSKGNAYTMVSRLKDTFESAVAGLVMFRAGRRDCPELDRLLEQRGATQISPEVRKIIEQHMKSCETCQGKRRELVSASALLRALVPLPLMPGVAARVRDGAWMQAHIGTAATGAGGAASSATSSAGSATTGSGGATSSGSATTVSGGAGSSTGSAATPAPAVPAAGHAAGGGSLPARLFHAIPGPAWLPAAAAAVLVAAVAIPAAVIMTRSGGGGSNDGVRAAAAAGRSGADATATPSASRAIGIAAGLVVENGGDQVTTSFVASCATHAGALWCWGLKPTVIAGMESGVTAVEAGDFHVCAVKQGAAWCWGINPSGQLGNGADGGPDSCITIQQTVPCYAKPVAVTGMSSGVTAISAGANASCAVKDGAASCWGVNDSGQLGDGTTANRNAPVAVSGMDHGVTAISAGTHHACAIRDGGAWCWGANDKGQLGDGSTASSAVPVAVSGLSSGVAAISAGAAHTCAIKDDGSAWCWGDNSQGQLGNRGGPNSPVPVVVSGLDGVTVISAGWMHTCAVTKHGRGVDAASDGAAWCWGRNNEGQLGTSNKTPSNVPVPVLSMQFAVTTISASDNWHTCALINSAPFCWGANNRGQLGDGTFNWSQITVKVQGFPEDAANATAPTPAAPSPTPAAAALASADEDALWAAIRATYPGKDFVLSCRGFVATAAKPECAAAGGWTADQLAGGLVTISFTSSESGIVVAFGRKGDGSWGYFVVIANGGGGPVLQLPGDASVCADGDGLNLRSEPSTTSAVVTLVRDNTVVRLDRFVLTKTGVPTTAAASGQNGEGWYHIASPQAGWGFARLLVRADQPQCAISWWHTRG